MPSATLSGVIAAAATPIDLEDSILSSAYIEHCRWLLAHGCDGINVLGTTGEANSISQTKRKGLMEAVASNDLPMDRLMVGTGGCSLEDTIDLTRHAMELGFAGQLILPPFYYKPVSDNGLFAFFSRIIETLADEKLKIYLYNFPQLTGIPFSITLVEKLYSRFPDTVIGLKDSSGDLDYAKSVASRCPGFAVFPSSEGMLLEGRSHGFAGCISATVNLTSSLSGSVWSDPEDPAAPERQREALAIRQAIAAYPLVPAVKFLLGELHDNPSWRNTLPPLLPLEAEQQEALLRSVGISPEGASLRR